MSVRRSMSLEPMLMGNLFLLMFLGLEEFVLRTRVRPQRSLNLVSMMKLMKLSVTITRMFPFRRVKLLKKFALRGQASNRPVGARPRSRVTMRL